MKEITWPRGTKLIRNDGKVAYYIGKSQRDNYPTVEFESSMSGWDYIHGDFPEYKSIAGNTYWYIQDELDRWTEYEEKGKKWDGILPMPSKWYVVWQCPQDTIDTNEYFRGIGRGAFGYIKTGVIDNTGSWRNYINDGNSKGGFVPKDGELEISMEQFRKYLMKEEESAPMKETSTGFNMGDYVKATERGYMGNDSRIMEKGEEGVIVEIDGNYIKVELKDGKIVRRLNSFLKRIPKPPESIMSQDSSPKWAIKRTPGNSKEVNSLINGKYGYNGLAHEDGYIHIPKISGYAGAMGRLQWGYKEISLEQLKAHLGLITEESKPVPKTYKYSIGQKVKYKDFCCSGIGKVIRMDDRMYPGPYSIELEIKDREHASHGNGGDLINTCRWFTESGLSECSWESSLMNSWVRTWDSPCVEYHGQELPSYSRHSMSAADVAEAVTEYLYGREKHTRVEKHPKEIIMGRKTRKKRGLI